jgi:hypothetical protein
MASLESTPQAMFASLGPKVHLFRPLPGAAHFSFEAAGFKPVAAMATRSGLGPVPRRLNSRFSAVSRAPGDRT